MYLRRAGAKACPSINKFAPLSPINNLTFLITAAFVHNFAKLWPPKSIALALALYQWKSKVGARDEAIYEWVKKIEVGLLQRRSKKSSNQETIERFFCEP